MATVDATHVVRTIWGNRPSLEKLRAPNEPEEKHEDHARRPEKAEKTEAAPTAAALSPATRAMVRMRSSLDFSLQSVGGMHLPHVQVNVKGVLDPQSLFLKVWHQVLLCKILYDLFLVPFVVTFEPNIEMAQNAKIYVFYISELLFCADIWVRLNTAFVEDGNVHHDKNRARLKYIKSLPFVFDVVALLPMALFPVPKPTSVSSKMYWELHKVLRLQRIPAYMLHLDDIYATHFEALKIFKTIVTTMILSHYVACVRYWFGFDDHHNNHWLPKRPTEHATDNTEYLQALFWSFGMLTGLFEGELPHSVAQFVFTIVVALCGFSVFTYLCGMFFMLSKCESGQSEEAEARINQLKHIMAFHKVPDHLQGQTIDYLKNYSTDAASNDRAAMKLLCPSIAKDLQGELLKGTVARIPVFVGCSDEFIRALTNALEAMFLPAHCTVFHVGDEGDAMYIIHAGVLDVIVGNVKVRELRKGDFVGELSLFSDRCRSATVVTTTYSILYRLSRFHTEKVLEGYPRFIRMIRETVVALIAKTDQQDTSKDEAQSDLPSQPESPPNERRGSVFSSQLKRLMTSESKGVFKLSQKRNVVVPEGSVDPADSHGEEARATAKDNAIRGVVGVTKTITVVNRLKRALTVKHNRAVNDVRIFTDQYARQPSLRSVEPPTKWRRLLLKKCVDMDSRARLWWIFVLLGVLAYDWILTPIQLVFPAVDQHLWYLYLLSVIVDGILFVDIYLNFNLSYKVNSEKIMDPVRTAARYAQREFAVDLMLAFPYSVFASLVEKSSLLRFPRLLRAWRLSGYLHEMDRLVHMNSKRKLMLFGGLLLMLCHVVACLYFSITYIEGFSHEEVNAWIPTHDIELKALGNEKFMTTSHEVLSADSIEVHKIASMQYFRSFFYATNVLTGLGKTVEPSSDTQYIIALFFMYSGFIITAVVVDNVQKRFTASAFEQKEFFAVRARIQFFLRRQKAPLIIHHRVNSYLDYWWAAHRGAHLEELLIQLPLAYRREVLRSICSPALQTLALLAGVRPVLSALETEFVDCVSFVLYGQGEFVYRNGDNAHSMYFLLHGSIQLAKGDTSNTKVPLGGFFGLKALQKDDAMCSYAEDAIACSGCILIRLAHQDAERLAGVFSNLVSALVQLEHRLLDNKLARFNDSVASRDDRATNPRWKVLLVDALDPDSRGAMLWETWLFVMMTLQWVVTLYHMSFGVEHQHFASVDGFTVFLEVSFLADVYFRCRMGYHEFGNKVMDVRRIRHRYIRSKGFLIDVAALFPLFMINWLMPTRRYELLNINKLFRLLRVPSQFTQLEQRYLKRTTELRILRLGYYTFLLTHLSGCVYHDFASHLSTANMMDPELENRRTAFGWNEWLLVESLEHASDSLKYFSSLFWSFGLMSASYQGELPKTTPQCLFSIATMMSGFFLFAYVIGNFSDVIEMGDADNREFNARLGSVRHLLNHFMLPEPLATKLTGFFFFRRYHSITQENLIEASLPPSLVTDIRLLNLQPMIAKVPFMGGMDPAITRMLVAQFSQVLVLKDDFVYRFGDDGTDMFFVYTGILAVMNQRTVKLLELHAAKTRRQTEKRNSRRRTTHRDSDQDLRHTSSLVSGDFFGENALFSDTPRNAFVLAKTSCILYSLSRQSLNVVFELYPSWKKQVIQSVKIQQKQQRLNGAATAKLTGDSSNRSGRQDTNNDDVDDAAVDTSPVRSVSPSESVVQPRWKRALLSIVVFLRRGTEAQSTTHIWWLRVIVFCTVFNAMMAPYRISIDGLERWTGVCVLVRLLDILTDIMSALDIWFNWHLRESALSIELYEQNLLESYKKERLVWDVIAAIPLDYVLSALNLEVTIWFRLLRCVKVVNLKSYLNEIDRTNMSYEWARFGTIWLLCLIYVFWCACAYLALAVFGEFGTDWNAWMPSHELAYEDPTNPDSHKVLLRFLRGMLHATTAFVKKARTFYPITTSHLVFSILMSFMGVLVMAFMIGEMASLYISLIRNQVEFRKNHISLELFLSRYKVSSVLRDRVHVFLSTLWSAHSGVNYEAVLADLPANMRTDTIIHITDQPLHAFLESAFRPLMRADVNGMNALLRSLATELKFEGYPRGESVISEGVISSSMYFVVHGHLEMASSSVDMVPVRYRKGQFFGEKGLIALSVSRFSVRALKACDLFSLSSDALVRILKSHSFLHLAFKAADEVVGEMRSQCDDGTSVPTDMKLWKATLQAVFKRQRDDWVSSTTGTGRSGTPTSPSSSRGATQWSALLVDILDGDLKESGGLVCFERLFQLLAPNGVIYEKPFISQRSTESRYLSHASSTRRIRFRDMVFKASRTEDKSAKSTKSTKVASVRDEVVAFVPPTDDL